MNLRRVEARVKLLDNNVLSYIDLINLSDSQCVKVNRNYFHYLIAKAEMLGIKFNEYGYVIGKYLEIDNMFSLIKCYNLNTSYYLISATDIKYLLFLIKDVPNSKVAFLKSDINVSDLNEIHEKIRRKYFLKIDSKNTTLSGSASYGRKLILKK